ncbi:hypothetical protein [Roseovarius sp. MMSF_3281]|uniref:hypothetical protein n=1 Tax=Roseovarius sp. MMSF_3281 TaxID=3046694 RepID=UPI00273D3127|nr:hypothetical protein [Roseovarius sp. MMSF_3281]
MEEHLYTLLSGAVSFPIAWGTLGSGTSTPRAVMFRTGGRRDMHLKGKGLMMGRVQIDCYGKTYLEAITASREVRAVLEGYRGGPVLGAFLEIIRDTKDDDTQLLHGVSLTFSITYRE